MSDETPDAKGAGGGGDGVGSSQPRSLAERRDYADAVVAWATAVSRLLAVADAWDSVVQYMRSTGVALDGADRDRKILDLMRTIDRIHEGREIAADTIAYFDGLVNHLKGIK